MLSYDMFKTELNRTCYITCVMLYNISSKQNITCVMLYNKKERSCVILHKSCHVIYTTYVQNRTEQNML